MSGVYRLELREAVSYMNEDKHRQGFGFTPRLKDIHLKISEESEQV
jgi:hypothetical protein